MKHKLNKQAWLEHGLAILSEHGFEALKADPLAKALKVSRGSFYWHFSDVRAFHEDLLGYWQQLVTQQVIDDIGGLGDGTSKTRSLVRLAFESDICLERAVRSWASQNEAASNAAQLVDRKRIEYLANLLVNEGIPPDSAKSRAAFLYWAYLGQTMTETLRSEYVTKAELDKIIDLFLGTNTSAPPVDGAHYQ